MTSTVAATQHKFSSLRRRLDQLGYRQPLGIESLPLVERLFLDLVHTTESFKRAKLSCENQTPVDGMNTIALVEAYKSDNAKLIKENNELHQQLIHIKEESEFAIKEMKSSLRRIEHEHADLKFLNNQYVHKLRSLEQESKQKTAKILQLQEKNFNAVVQTPDGRKKNIPFRRQRMELDSELPSAVAFTASGSVMPAADPYMADLLKVADDSIAQLREEINICKDEKSGLEGKISNLKKQVDLRDAEVVRLTQMLEGGRPYDVVALEARSQQNERTMSHLNIQVDYLQQKNRELQDQLDKMTSKTQSSDDLNARNYELTRELKDVDLIAQLEKDRAVHDVNLESVQTKAELAKARNQLKSMEHEMVQLKDENDHCLSELETVKKELNMEQQEIVRLTSLVHKIQDDKIKLGQKVKKLSTTERNLIQEIDQLHQSHRNGTQRRSESVSATVDAFVQGLEEERNYWMSEANMLQQMLASKPISSSMLTSQELQSVGHGFTSPATNPLHLQSNAERKVASELNELAELKMERDGLQKMLDQFERNVAEIQANVRVLTLERDNLSSTLDETRQELARTRQDAIRSPKSAKASLAAQAVLKRVENERDEAVLSCRNLTVERDTLRERLKIATESHLAEHTKLERTIEDLETALNAVELNRKTVEERLLLSQTYIESQETRLKESITDAVTARDDAAQHRGISSQMRFLAEQTERSLKDAQSQLTSKVADIQAAADHIKALEDQLDAVRHASQSDRDEIMKLRSAIAELDREKDDLQVAVDEKTEQEVKKTEAITSKDQMIGDLRSTIVELEAVISSLKDNVASKDCEVVSLRRQLDCTSEELIEAGRRYEVVLRENRRLQDDLATMSQENQSVNQDLEDALKEKLQLKEQEQAYILEIKRCEELLSAKEQERNDILDQYRSLSQEAQQFEAHTHHLENEGSNLKLELLTKESEVRRMRDRLDKAERDMQEHDVAKHAYEVQLSNMTKSIASLEEVLCRSEEEKRALHLDLSAVRDLCARLESNKDSLQRQLVAKSLDQEKLQTLLDDLKYESEMLRSQVTSERSTKQNLESLLQENRNKEWQVQLSVQEKEAEVQLLRDRLEINNSKIESQARELNQHRTHTIEIESDLERLKRQLISERFERERAIQELRRNGLSLPGETSQLHTISPNSLEREIKDGITVSGKHRTTENLVAT